ncbi:MAG TPA: SGNH/GDSL hydrolase family protein [Candidatus Polarisedimenticolia bacterium]|nr:SGNH/GDSL hydrolase family protein [Candidatus Polarisedimenticolia bacterium]
MPRIPKLAGNLLLAAVSTLLALAACEAALRIFRPVQYLKPPEPEKSRNREESLYRPSSVPGLAYEMRPGRDGEFEGMRVRTNHLGMRGAEPEPDATAVYRIVALGDSFTFGFGVEERDTFVSLLQDRLGERPAPGGKKVEVLNLGVVGYASRDEAVVMKVKALPLRPQGVIIAYILNDPEIDPRPSLHKYFDPVPWWRQSHLLRLLHLGWNSLQVQFYGGGDYIRYLHAPGRAKWHSVEKAFRSIADDARGAGAWVVVAIFPITPKTTWSGYLYGDLHAQVARAARAQGFGVVDLLPVFRTRDPKDLVVSPTDDHPNALGHRLAAEAILGALPLPAPSAP